MNLSMNDIENLLWSFQKYVPEDKVGHKTKVQLLKIALLQEVNLPYLKVTDGDPFSAKWHNLFEETIQKLKNIFSSLGATPEQIEAILTEYGKISHHNVWRRAS